MITVIAHGLVGRADLPIPEWLFGWAAAAVLVVSFAALAVLWREPVLEEPRLRALPGWLARPLTSPVLGFACGAIGLFLLFVVLWSGFKGSEVPTNNFAPTFVYVIFFVGLVPASVLLGDVFRVFNPWRAGARAVAWVSSRAAGGPVPAPFAYPEWLGRWPAAVGLLVFAWLELASVNGDLPRNVAIATLIYSAVAWAGMAAYGVEAWCERGETFSVYYGLFARLSVWEPRGRELFLRPPLAGAPRLDPVPGTVAMLGVMIGGVTFDGASEGPLWNDRGPRIAGWFEDHLGFSTTQGIQASGTVGLLLGVALVLLFYRLGAAGARGPDRSAGEVMRAFVHTLVPIAFVYVVAHYFSFLITQGQAIYGLASDPLGEGSDYFGTAGTQVDYAVISATAIWYVQVGVVVIGHVAGLVLAHDRALILFDDPRRAARSQYWMLAVMVGFTSLALWLLSQANG